MPVPNTFANATATIPLSQLDANFATTITLGNTAIQLGNTVSTLNNMTLANVTVSSGNVTITNVTVTTANVTTANIATAEIANVTVSGTGTFAAGSNTAPSITTSGDTNTGIFFPAADTIAFTEGGVESMRITSAGNVGIGTTSPNTLLHLSANPPVLALGSTGTADPRIDFYDQATTTIAGSIFLDQSEDNLCILRTASGSATNGIRIDSSGNVGIGTSSPTNKLSIAGGLDFTASAFSGSGTGIYLVAANTLGFVTSGNTQMRITSDGELLIGGTTAISAASALSVQKLNGVPEITIFRNDTSIVANDVLGQIAFYGNDTTSNTPTLLAGITAPASGTHAAGDNPTDLAFFTTPDGTATAVEAMRITQAKNLKIGGTASRATTEGTNQLVLFNGTAPVGTLTNGVSFYSAAGEARVMDAAGNSTLLSPHDQATNEWIFHSKHTPTGKVLRIDVEKMLRFINDHFGLDMVHEFTEE